jgi:Family of unknown function (DUF6498)
MSRQKKFSANLHDLFSGVLSIDPAEFRKISVISLIIANFGPLIGVLFLHWNVYPTIVLFWMESLVITLITLIKIAAVPSHTFVKSLEKILLIPYFCLSYGFFLILCGLAIFFIFSGYSQSSSDFPSFSQIYQSLAHYQLQWALLALTISHGISFVTNYMRKKEYQVFTTNDLMWVPYNRAGVIIILVFIGGVLVKETGSIIALTVLILIKVYADIRLHLNHHANTVQAPILDEVEE